MQTSLSLRHWLKRQTLWIDYGCIKLPFHGDGDLQELQYHLEGKYWWQYEMGEVAPYVKPGYSVLDIGANLGFMSGIFSRLIGASGHVYSFEPSPVIYAKLQETLQANGYTNVTAHNLGCGEEERSMTLFSPQCSGNATLRPGEDMKRTRMVELNVRIVRLDDFLAPVLQRLDFVKIDTEGYEPEVLAGAVGLLQRFRPVVYIELGNYFSDSSKKAIQILRDLHYTFPKEIDPDNPNSGANFIALPGGYTTLPN